MANNPDVLIIIPPFASIEYPMIGPSILKSMCNKQSISVKILYLNLDLASIIGYELYQKISLSSFSIMAGELLFRDFAFPGKFENSVNTFKQFFDINDKINVSSPQIEGIKLNEIERCITILDSFLKESLLKISSLKPKLIGISSVFQQNVASIAIARLIKVNDPEAIIVLGGANASSPMGEELSANCDVFDYIFSGEADFEFPNFLNKYFSNKILPLEKIVECPPIANMDNVAVPDYEDYFQQLEYHQNENSFNFNFPVKLPIETSRGCWWGAKKHCTFCGLNGKEMSFRNKSASRTIMEINYLSETYHCSSFQATDNIMPLNFKSEVLPQLSEMSNRNSFFYEVKSNLKDEELDLFCLAGINCIQPGIESFSSDFLRNIDKGVKGIHNIWLLRECMSRQIQVTWNLLAGIPYDKIKDYEDTLKIVPYIEHFHPPQGVSNVVIDRYSPYHSFPEKFGIKDVKPLQAYFQIYPSEFNLDNLAYHFTGSFDSAFNNDENFAKFFTKIVEDSWINKWINQQTPPKLYAVPIDFDRLFIEDTRSCAIEQRVTLNKKSSEMLKKYKNPQKKIEENNSTFKFLVERNFIIFHEDSWLSVVTEPNIGFNLRNSILNKNVKNLSI